jgi:hypothetical protein
MIDYLSGDNMGIEYYVAQLKIKIMFMENISDHEILLVKILFSEIEQ